MIRDLVRARTIARVHMLAALAALLLPLTAFAQDKPASDGIVAPRVTVGPSVRRTIVETVTVTGSLVPREEVHAGAEISGLRITAILAEEGDYVKKGAVLARLSRAALDAKIAQSDAALLRAEAAIAQAVSQIKAAEANLGWATADLDRARKLLRRGVSTQASIDQKTSVANASRAQLQVAKDSLRAARADRTNLQAQRRELMVQVAQTKIVAPEAGVIATRAAKIGAMVSAGSPPLFKIIKNGQIELDGEVIEQRLLAIKPGQNAKITLANGQAVSGAVRLVSPQIDPATRLGKVRISIHDKDAVRAGAFARALVEIRRSQSVSVPASAVLYDGRKARVQVADGAIVRARPVKLGQVAGGWAEIRSGLEPGAKVILRAGAFLRDGDAITPVAQGAESR